MLYINRYKIITPNISIDQIYRYINSKYIKSQIACIFEYYGIFKTVEK